MNIPIEQDIVNHNLYITQINNEIKNNDRYVMDMLDLIVKYIKNNIDKDFELKINNKDYRRTISFINLYKLYETQEFKDLKNLIKDKTKRGKKPNLEDMKYFTVSNIGYKILQENISVDMYVKLIMKLFNLEYIYTSYDDEINNFRIKYLEEHKITH